jgi:hypothetical protein
VRVRGEADHRIEVVRGSMDDATAEELLRLWATHGVLAGDQARRRLADVVCVVRDRAGIVLGSCSVAATTVAMLADRIAFEYRAFVAGSVPAPTTYELFNRAFDVLDDEHEPGNGGPIGMYLDLDPADVAVLPRDAIWPDTGLMHAGYADDGRQLRVRYFTDAVVI